MPSPEAGYKTAFAGKFGASADAVHITAPDRSGAGLTRAGRAAIEEAEVEPERIAVVSAHGTATPYNDAAEAKAVHALCAPGDPVVHPFKAQIGHTLGAAGVLETLAVAHAMGCGVLPAAYGEGEIDPEATVRLLSRAEAQTPYLQEFLAEVPAGELVEGADAYGPMQGDRPIAPILRDGRRCFEERNWPR